MTDLDKLGVIFIDDERILLDGVNRVVRKCKPGWKLHFSSSVPDAIIVMRDNVSEFDVLVCDINMPFMSGLDALRMCKRWYPNVLRIALSGQLDGRSLLGSEKLSDLHICKPISSEKLCDIIVSAYQEKWSENSQSNQSVKPSP